MKRIKYPAIGTLSGKKVNINFILCFHGMDAEYKQKKNESTMEPKQPASQGMKKPARFYFFFRLDAL
jgi:hypothetical protein